MITILVAFDDNRLIGRDGKLPWHIPEDLALFKKRTMGQIVVMGRKTWEGLPKRPLVGRINVIISSNFIEVPNTHSLRPNPMRIYNSLKQAVKDVGSHRRPWPKNWYPQPDIFIIGGGQLYRSAMKIADRIIVSKIHGKFEGDTYFPKIGWRWRKKNVEHHDGFDVVEYHRMRLKYWSIFS